MMVASAKETSVKMNTLSHEIGMSFLDERGLNEAKHMAKTQTSITPYQQYFGRVVLCLKGQKTENTLSKAITAKRNWTTFQQKYPRRCKFH